MRSKLSILLMLVMASLNCGGTDNFKATKLPSGKEIKIKLIIKTDFPNSDPALLMDYLTEIPIDDKAALRKEIDEIWSVFQADVENARLKAGVIRATHNEGFGFFKSSKGYGYVFVKRDDGQWHCLA